MPLAIPFLPSETNYRLLVPIDDQTIVFDVRWNSRDEAFYLDIYEDNDDVIALNIKVVTGIRLARFSQHDFFADHALIAVDTTRRGQAPGFDDLGARVELILQGPEDL